MSVSGKILRIIKQAHITRTPIECPDEETAKNIKDLAFRLGYQISTIERSSNVGTNKGKESSDLHR
jgi:hypothetical protein